VQMPELQTLEQYRAVYHDETVWLPIAREIARRHGAGPGMLRRGPDGTHIVYFMADDLVLQLFSPLFGEDITSEFLVTPIVDGRLGVATPSVVARGRLADWSYLIATRVPGRSVRDVRDQLRRDELRAILGRVGEVIARLRSVPTAGLRGLSVDWSFFEQEQLRRAPQRAAPPGLSLSAEDVHAFMRSVPRVPKARPPVLLLADITDEHVLVSDEMEQLRMSGLVDFGDAFLGDRDYELVAPGLTLARGDRELLRALLAGAGYDVDADGDGLRRRLMAQTLIHRYATLLDCAELVDGAENATTLEELSEVFWPIA